MFAEFRDVQNRNFVVHGLTRMDGTFAVELPVGLYDVYAGDARSLDRLSRSRRVAVTGGLTEIPEPVEADALSSDLESFLPELMAEQRVRATAVAVVEDGRIVYSRTFGVDASATPATRDTLFRVASITKPITTMTVLSMVESGEWTLDEPLATYWIAPDIADDERHSELTSRLALRHLTGLPNWRELCWKAWVIKPETYSMSCTMTGQAWETRCCGLTVA